MSTLVGPAGSQDSGPTEEDPVGRSLPRLGTGRPFGGSNTNRPMGSIGRGRPFGASNTSRPMAGIGRDRSFGSVGAGRPFGGSGLVPQPPSPGDSSAGSRTSGFRSPNLFLYGNYYDYHFLTRPIGDPGYRDRHILEALRAPVPLAWTPFDSTQIEARRLGPVAASGLESESRTAVDPGTRVAQVLVREGHDALKQGRYQLAWQLLDLVQHDAADPTQVLLPRAWALLALGRDREAAATFEQLDRLQEEWRRRPTSAPVMLSLQRDARSVQERLRVELGREAAAAHLEYLEQILATLLDQR